MLSRLILNKSIKNIKPQTTRQYSSLIKRTLCQTRNILASRNEKRNTTIYPEYKIPGDRRGYELEIDKETGEKYVDYSRKQPEYESPYGGPASIKNLSKFGEEYDLWWDNDGVQIEFIMDPDTNDYSTREVLMWTLQFFTFFFAFWWFYRRFLRPATHIHPMTMKNGYLSKMSKADFEAAKERVRKLKQKAKELGLEVNL